jgi:hypothetical protein
MRASLLLFTFLSSSFLYAKGWSSQTRKLAVSYSLPIKSSMVSTIWGNIITKQYALTLTKPLIEKKKIQQ